MSKPDQTTARIRKICLSHSKAEEVIQFGHPFFKINKKPFAVLGEDGLAIKVEKQSQPVFLKDPRFQITAYVGRHGWITLTLAGKLDWDEIESLIQGSYELVTAKAKKK